MSQFWKYSCFCGLVKKNLLYGNPSCVICSVQKDEHSPSSTTTHSAVHSAWHPPISPCSSASSTQWWSHCCVTAAVQYLCLQQKTAGKQGFDRNPPWLSSFAPNTKRHVCCMQQLHTDCLLPVLHSPDVVDYYPGIKLDVTSPNPMSPGLNTVGEDFIIETSTVMWTSVSEAFPPCQEK